MPDPMAGWNCERWPELHVRLHGLRVGGLREKKVREYAVGAPGAHGHRRLGRDRAPVPSPREFICGLYVKVDDRLIEMKPAFWVEGVNDNIFVNLPWIERRQRAFGQEPICLDTATARIIARYYDLSCEEVVRKPDLVLREEPMRVVAHVEFSKGRAGIRRRDLHAGDVVLDVALPCQVGFGVRRELMACMRKGDEVQGLEEGDYAVDDLGREGEELVLAVRGRKASCDEHVSIPTLSISRSLKVYTQRTGRRDLTARRTFIERPLRSHLRRLDLLLDIYRLHEPVVLLAPWVEAPMQKATVIHQIE